MPDQRMHDLWINSESACIHKSCEVHDVRFIDSESVASSTTMGRSKSLRSSGAGRQTCWSGGRPEWAAVASPDRWLRTPGPGSSGIARVLSRTDEGFSAALATARPVLLKLPHRHGAPDDG